MSDDTNTDADSMDEQGLDNDTLAVSSTYKILGELSASDGAGVLGRNNASGGTPIGVEGAVPDDSDGYGLATPNSARIGEAIESPGGHSLTIDGSSALTLEPRVTDFVDDLAGSAVVAGYSVNTVNGNAGATISGGGKEGSTEVDGSTRFNTNAVFGDYGTIGGGYNNRANVSATVGGGSENTASGSRSTVAGGDDNTASGSESTVGGGFGNTANSTESTVAGGDGNTASGTESFVGGGVSNEASGGQAVVCGGDNNVASSTEAFAGGGEGNVASSSEAFVGGGFQNEASGDQSAVGGGLNNKASDKAATVPGGSGSTASGQYSFAAGRKAEATEDGAFVWGDSSNSTVTSGGADEVRFQAGGGFVIDNTNFLTISDGIPDSTGSSVAIDSSGTLVRDSSSARYKTNIRPLGADTSRVLDLEPRRFEYEETGDEGTGLIAEEVDEEVPELVIYDDEGRPDAVQYDRVGVYLAPEVGENRDRLADLEAENDDLRRQLDEKAERIDDLEERLASVEAKLTDDRSSADD